MGNENKSNKISLAQLVLLGLGSLIGSGWLFGAWEASSIAGPAAIISWVIGFIVIGTISYNYIEIGTMFPQSGGMSNYAQYTHGSLLALLQLGRTGYHWLPLFLLKLCRLYNTLVHGLGIGLNLHRY